MSRIYALAATLLGSIAMMPVAASAAATTPGPPIQNPLPVIVTNPPNQGTNTFIVNPGDIGAAVGQSLGVGTPVSFTLTNDLIANRLGPPYTVPTGKRLIIEDVSGLCQAVNATVLGLSIGLVDGFSIKAFSIFLLSIAFPSSTLTAPTFGRTTKVYFNPGDVLNLVFISSGSEGENSTDLLQCRVAVNGQLTNAP